MTILESRYMETMPRLMRELVDQLEELRKEVADLRKTIEEKK